MHLKNVTVATWLETRVLFSLWGCSDMGQLSEHFNGIFLDASYDTKK